MEKGRLKPIIKRGLLVKDTHGGQEHGLWHQTDQGLKPSTLFMGCEALGELHKLLSLECSPGKWRQW